MAAVTCANFVYIRLEHVQLLMSLDPALDR
jgi:hypothetical protein